VTDPYPGSFYPGELSPSSSGIESVSTFDPAWMVIDAISTTELATAAANGATHGLVQVKWDQCQSTLDGAVNAAGVITNINNVIAAGLKVCLRVSPQYIPSFVATSGVKFKRNGNVEWAGVTADGNNVRDWVWSASTRALVDDFYTKLFNQLNWANIDRVQLGGLMFGEVSYPTSDGTQWWAYSSPAQTGTDLATGQSVCPVPGHVPSTGNTWTANDISFNNWYQQSLRNWMLWLIAKHRAYFNGPIWVLHPGFGYRANYHNPTSSDAARALGYREAMAKGVDWSGQIAAYPDSNVHPYSTWGDGTHPWTPNPFSDANDANAAAWYHLLRVARQHNRHHRIWGENTATESPNSVMDRVFNEGAVAFGYEGFVWLNHGSLATGTNDTYANWATRIASVEPVTPWDGYRRGINLAGGEFAHTSVTLPGTYSTDYSYPSAAELNTMYARGHRSVRIPARAERLFTAPNGILRSTEIARIRTVVNDAKTAGFKEIILDVFHNYARWINSAAQGGSELVLGQGWNVTDYVNLWVQLSTEFRNVPEVQYDLMNEPHDLTGSSGSFSGTTRYDWNDGTVQGWTGDGASVSNVNSKLRFALTPTGTGFYQTRKDDAGTDRNGPVTGNILRADVTLASGTPGTWTTRLQWMNTSFAWQNAISVTYNRIDTGATVSSLIAGVAVRVTAEFASNIPAGRPFAIQIESGAPTVGTYSADVDNFAQGTASGSLGAAQFWESITQQAVTAIRNNGDTNRIHIPLYGWSAVHEVQNNHGAGPWIVDSANNHVYHGHHYFDIDNSGDYPDSYPTEQTNAVSAGYTSVVARSRAQVKIFTDWLRTHNVRGHIGEFGWPNTGDTDDWNAVGEAIYTLLDQQGVGCTYWAAGERWGNGYNLSAYTGTGQTTLKSQATVIERHLTVSPASGAVSLTANVVLSAGAGVNQTSSGNTFGKTTDGTSSSASSQSRLFVSLAIPTQSGVVQTGHARVFISGAVSVPAKFIIYADSGGAPGVKLAESNIVTVTETTETLKEFSFSGGNQITVSAGIPYWIGVAWQDPGTGFFNVSRDTNLSGRREQVFTWPTLPLSFGTPNAINSGPIDAYVTHSSSTQIVQNVYPSSTTFPSATLFPNSGVALTVNSTLTVGASNVSSTAFVAQPTITIAGQVTPSQVGLGWTGTQDHPAGVYSVVLEGSGNVLPGAVSLNVVAYLVSGIVVGSGSIVLTVPTVISVAPVRIASVFPITGTFAITSDDNVGAFIIALESIPVQHLAVVSMVVEPTIDISPGNFQGAVSLTVVSTFSAKPESYALVILNVSPTIQIIPNIKERVALVAVVTLTIQGPTLIVASAVQLSVVARIRIVGRREKKAIFRTNFPYPPMPHGFRVIAQKILTGEIIDWELPVSDDFEYTRQLSGPTLMKGSFKPEIQSVQELNLDGYAVMFHVEIDNIIRASGIMLPPQYSESALNFTCEGIAALPHYAQWEASMTGIQVDAFDIVRSIWQHVQSHPTLNLGVQLPLHLAGRTFGEPPAIEVLDPSGGVVQTLPESPRTRAARYILARLSSVDPKLPINEDWTWADAPALVSEWNDSLLEDYEANGPTPSDDPTSPNAITWLTKLVADSEGQVPEGAETRDKDAEPYELLWYNGTNCGEELDKLAGDTPFDYIEYQSWNQNKTDVEFFMDLGFPRLGAQRTDLLFNEDNLLEVVPAQEGEDTYASAVLVVGAGEGEATIRGYASQNFGERVGKTVVITDKSITTTERANSVAVQELGIRRGRTFEIDELVVQANHDNAPLGSYDVGDDIQAEVFVPWLNYLHRDWYRITSITFQPSRDHVRLGIQRSASFRYPVVVSA
jgi:hypothetical protein